MKYIDSEKLKAEIERRREKCADIAADERNEDVAEDYRGKEVAYDETSSLIASLQQEQPEVDFEKELDRIWFDNKLGNYFDNDALDYAHIKTLCKHFYELGLNARKEE